MKAKDFIWIVLILGISSLILIPATRVTFETLTTNHPYMMGFIKTALLASMGERLVVRIRSGHYFSDKGFILKFIVWGFLGMVFVVIFKIFAEGITAAQTSNLLPIIESPIWVGRFLTAFMISLFMNLCFAPAFMLLHRYTDLYIELSEGNLKDFKKLNLKYVTHQIDFNVFIHFVILKTIPFFWIPAHTVTFLLPENYRVLMAAYLSIALGLILTVAKHKKQNT
jgi:hypothetical protein